MTNHPHSHRELVISYLQLRRFIGILGISFPLILMLGFFLVGGSEIRVSLSSYYHTPMRDLFVGISCALGVFLISYRGYDRRDNIAGDIAGVSVILTALFPTADPSQTSHTAMELLASQIHAVTAGIYFLTLAYFCICLFTKSAPGPVSDAKKMRNRIYRACGYTMLLCLVGIAALMQLEDKSFTKEYSLVFWLETAATLAFGISWLIKGKALAND